MMKKKAQLENGRIIEYFPNMIGEGTMKEVYLTKDREFVLCFYKNDIANSLRLRRLQKIWNQLFCWPTSIVKKPKLGVMTPVYPKNYFFASGQWRGKEKKGRWFISPKLRQYLPKEELGTWLNYFILRVWRILIYLIIMF